VIDAAQWVRLRKSLISEIDPVLDSLRFYFLGNSWQERVEHVGAKPSYDPEAPMIV
jgi:CRISPR-associated protein Cas2